MMTLKKLLPLMLMLLPALSTMAQEEDWEYVDDFNNVKDIVARWTEKSLLVENTFKEAPVRNFAMAFCKHYQQYAPNKAMVDYLKKPGNYTWEEKGYYSVEDIRNGYVKCDMGGQFDHMTEICYWKRKNGHALVGILMQMGREGERADNALLFYDYDPKTRMLKPDVKVWNTVCQYIGSHEGSCFAYLPKEGKNIDFTMVTWTMENDFEYDDYTLKWTGDSFIEEKTKRD